MIEQIILLVDKNLEIADILIALVAFIVSIVALVYTKITDAMILEHHVAGWEGFDKLPYSANR